MTTHTKPRAEVWRPFVAGQARPCVKCGMPMIFVPGKPKPDGTPTQIPLDLKTLRVQYDAARYPRAEEVGPRDLPPLKRGSNGEMLWEARSHFETCVAASSFSRSKA